MCVWDVHLSLPFPPTPILSSVQFSPPSSIAHSLYSVSLNVDVHSFPNFDFPVPLSFLPASALPRPLLSFCTYLSPPLPPPPRRRSPPFPLRIEDFFDLMLALCVLCRLHHWAGRNDVCCILCVTKDGQKKVSLHFFFIFICSGKGGKIQKKLKRLPKEEPIFTNETKKSLRRFMFSYSWSCRMRRRRRRGGRSE